MKILYIVLCFSILHNCIRRIPEKGRVNKIWARLYKIVASFFFFHNSKMMGLHTSSHQPKFWIANTGEGKGVQNSSSVVQNYTKCVQNYGNIFILEFENGGAGGMDLPFSRFAVTAIISSVTCYLYIGGLFSTLHHLSFCFQKNDELSRRVEAQYGDVTAYYFWNANCS